MSGLGSRSNYLSGVTLSGIKMDQISDRKFSSSGKEALPERGKLFLAYLVIFIPVIRARIVSIIYG